MGATSAFLGLESQLSQSEATTLAASAIAIHAILPRVTFRVSNLHTWRPPGCVQCLLGVDRLGGSEDQSPLAVFPRHPFWRCPQGHFRLVNGSLLFRAAAAAMQPPPLRAAAIAAARAPPIGC